MSDLRNVSSNPHIRAKDTTSRIMLTVVIALLLPAFFGIYNFGFRALVLILISIATCVLTEYIYEKLMKKPITIGDFSAVVTGLLLALNLPVSVPFWIPVVGGVFAILVVKMLFGGLGQNFMNPALAGRCFLLISFTSLMTNFNCDAYTGATPLASLKAGESVNVLNMILGRTAGTIGETSVIAIVLGACVLIVAGVIDLRVPGSYIASFAVFVLLFAALSGIAISPAYGRRWSDARCILYGDGLCNPSCHQKRTIHLRCDSRFSDRDLPYFRRERRGRILCDYSGQPSGSVD